MRHDVFISHAATDKINADEITDHLAYGGVKYWVRPGNIKLGENWADSIVKAIEDCSMLISLLELNQILPLRQNYTTEASAAQCALNNTEKYTTKYVGYMLMEKLRRACYVFT